MIGLKQTLYSFYQRDRAGIGMQSGVFDRGLELLHAAVLGCRKSPHSSWIKMSTHNHIYNEVSYFTIENETKQMTVFV